MKFELDFNRENDDEFILHLGARWEDYGEYKRMVIDLDNFEDLEKLLDQVKVLRGEFYSAVVDFDPPTIYLDKDV